jgi:hypothetical protein
MCLQPAILRKLALKPLDSTNPTLSYELHGKGGRHLSKVHGWTEISQRIVAREKTDNLKILYHLTFVRVL